MGVGILPTILETPSTKVARALAALESKAALKIEEGLRAARAVQRENLLDHAVAQDICRRLGCSMLSTRETLVLFNLALCADKGQTRRASCRARL